MIMKPIGYAITILSAIVLCNCSPQTDNNRKTVIAGDMEKVLKENVIDKWYPQSVDTVYGGFLSSFTYDFKPTDNQEKMIVTQSRHTWSNAKASELYPDDPQYLSHAKHGFQFLKEVMWDKENGGFFTLVSREGKPKEGDTIKTAYGNAFGIFALAAYYKASGDTAALSLAKKTFWWLEKGSHDSVKLGYFQHLNKKGVPITRPNNISNHSDLGYKDQNSSIHLLEAFTELYQVWPDSLLGKRLKEMLFLIRDTITTPRGSLTLFLLPDWTPVSFRDSSRKSVHDHTNLDHISFGHDVETAFLMIEASEILKLENDTTTERIAKKMVDHALRNGWDNSVGGFYDEGYYFKDGPDITIIRDSKNWWAQAEGMNALLLMAEKYPDDEMRYFEKFEKHWEYCNQYLIDHENGDWFAGGLDKQPDMKTALKGHIWKANYHQFRSLMLCSKRLKHM
jgi:mannobiose 2-epimerase